MTAPTTVAASFRFRRGTSANWTSRNPVLALGEPAYELDTGKFKIGDGTTAWIQLPYFAPASVSPATGSGLTDEQLLAHINSKTPHPVYDDTPDLVLIYKNAKV